jgi:hypothetical protein
MLVNEPQRMWKEAAAICFEALSWNTLWRIEENHNELVRILCVPVEI